MSTTRPINVARTLVGLLLLALGGLFLVDQAGWADMGDVIGRWWPLIIVALGLLQLAANPRAIVGPLIVTGFGAVLLLFTLDIVPGAAGDVFWALIIIAIGAFILLSRGVRPGRVGSSDETVSSFVAFGGTELASRSTAFRGGWVAAAFGGATLDLRDATLAVGGATIDATAAFGGIDVLVPKGWRISISGLPIFGGYDDKTKNEGPLPPDAPELTVNAVAMFGGIEVKHEK